MSEADLLHLPPPTVPYRYRAAGISHYRFTDVYATESQVNTSDFVGLGNAGARPIPWVSELHGPGHALAILMERADAERARRLPRAYPG